MLSSLQKTLPTHCSYMYLFFFYHSGVNWVYFLFFLWGISISISKSRSNLLVQIKRFVNGSEPRISLDKFFSTCAKKVVKKKLYSKWTSSPTLSQRKKRYLSILQGGQQKCTIVQSDTATETIKKND